MISTVKIFVIAGIVIYSTIVFNLSEAQSYNFNCSQPPNFLNFDVNICCRIPEINLGNAHERCDNYINKLKLQTNMEYPYPSYMHVCYPECIYRETGSLVNGEIQMENVKNFLINNIHPRDKDILPQIFQSFEMCIENIEMHMKRTGKPSYAKLAEGCSPFASMIFGCVNAETFLHCPPKMWRNERNCNLAKNFAEQCNPLPHVPLPVT